MFTETETGVRGIKRVYSWYRQSSLSLCSETGTSGASEIYSPRTSHPSRHSLEETCWVSIRWIVQRNISGHASTFKLVGAGWALTSAHLLQLHSAFLSPRSTFDTVNFSSEETGITILLCCPSFLSVLWRQCLYCVYCECYVLELF